MDEEQTAFIQSTCTCAICTTLNEIISKWDTWHPSEGMETSIKNSIEIALSSQPN
jgi:hypothetical protein